MSSFLAALISLVVELRRQGSRPYVVGACAELTVAAATLGMVVAADRWIDF